MIEAYRPRTIAKGNFSSTLLLHTRTPDGLEAFTYLNTYERGLFHAEVMTHRWSRNASSARAVPYARNVEKIDRDPAMPLYLGVNKSGMLAGGPIEDEGGARALILELYGVVRGYTDRLVNDFGVHKEVANRYVEPWSWITSIQTKGRAQLMNEFHLRLDRGANQNYQRLAVSKGRLLLQSSPLELDYGDWHVPFHDYETHGIPSGTPEEVREFVVWSAARAAWTSYDAPHKEGTFELAAARHDKCLEDLHVTPLEHQLRVCRPEESKGVVPGYQSYRMMVPGERVDDFDLRARIDQYEGRDFLPPAEETNP